MAGSEKTEVSLAWSLEFQALLLLVSAVVGFDPDFVGFHLKLVGFRPELSDSAENL